MNESSALLAIGLVALFYAFFAIMWELSKSTQMTNMWATLPSVLLDIVIGLFGLACYLAGTGLEKLEKKLADKEKGS